MFVVVAAAHDAPRGQKKGDVGVAETIPHEHISKPMGVFDEVVDYVNVPLPQVVEEVEVAQISAERIMEHIAFKVPQEHGQERIAVQRVNIKALPVMEESGRVHAEHPTGARAESHVEPKCALPSATDGRENRGTESASTSGAHTNTNQGTDCGPSSATARHENRGNDSARTSRAHARQARIRDHTVEITVPHIMAKISGLFGRQCLQILKETAEAVTVVPFERVQQRTFELIADVSQFEKGPSKWSGWSRENACSDGSTSKSGSASPAK